MKLKRVIEAIKEDETVRGLEHAISVDYSSGLFSCSCKTFVRTGDCNAVENEQVKRGLRIRGSALFLPARKSNA